MIRELTMDKVSEIAQEAGLTKDGFTKDDFFYAWLYKNIIWQLALIFVRERGALELTNSEYLLDENSDVVEVALILEFDKKTMKQFAIFLRRHKKIIPPELRKMFVLSAGSHYNKQQRSLLITADKITTRPIMNWANEGSDGSLTDEIHSQDVYSGNRIFNNNLATLLANNQGDMNESRRG